MKKTKITNRIIGRNDNSDAKIELGVDQRRGQAVGVGEDRGESSENTPSIYQSKNTFVQPPLKFTDFPLIRS